VAHFRRLAVLAAVTVVGLCFGPAAEAGVQTLVFKTGPIDVTPYDAITKTLLIDSPSVDGYVTGMKADLVDADGKVVPNTQVMLHHVVFAKIGPSDYTCPGTYAQRFFAEGEEHYAMSLPDGYGYPNKGSDHWGLLAMLMNHFPDSATVWVRYTVTYATGERLQPVKPIWLDMNNCKADPIFDVPGTGGPGSTYSRHVDLTMPESGRLLTAGGHMHGGGIKLELSDETCGRSLFTSLPSWNGPIPLPLLHEPGPTKMSSFQSPLGIPVAAGDDLRLTAVYDNGRPHTRVMGIMIVYLVPTLVSGCEPVPGLTIDLGTPGPPTNIRVPLLKKPAGALRRNIKSTWVGDYRYGAQRVSIKRGTKFTWRFIGAVPHDVTLVSGPVGFSSPWTQNGGTFTHTFSRPGTYRLFCSLHPARMTEIIQVRKNKR
jgi:plastocyanin